VYTRARSRYDQGVGTDQGDSQKNGKSRTVTKTITKLVDEDFVEDPHAAEKLACPWRNM
jgi:hypothetical protein